MAEPVDVAPPPAAKFRHDVADLVAWRRRISGVRLAILPTTTFRSNPLPVGRRLFVSVFAPGAVLAVDRLGRILWRRRLPPYADAEMLFAGSLLYAKSPHTLFALDLRDGRVIWTFSPCGTRGETMYSAPTVKDGRLFIGDRAGYLHALDARTGRPIWSLLTSRAKNNDVNGPPLVHGRRVVVATNARRVLAVDARSGRIVWTQRIAGPSIHEIGVAAGALMAACGSAIYRLDPDTGRILSRRTFRRRRLTDYVCRGHRAIVRLASSRPGWSEIVGLRDGVLVFRRVEELLGSLRWLPDGTVVESRFDGLGVLDPSTGNRIHHIQFPNDAWTGPPALAGGRLYVLTERGGLWALRWPPPARG